MVTTPNLFGPGYSLATLTEAINIIPNLWGRLQEYKVFGIKSIVKHISGLRPIYSPVLHWCCK